MFKHGLVAVVKSNGKIFREINENGSSVIYLPFGSEYSLEFKNNENRKAVVSVSIDGKDVMDGKQLIVDANQRSEIKGFLEGSLAKNSFRFIEQTEKIKNHRGESIDDGIIRIEFQFEKELPKIERTIKRVIEEYHPPRYPFWYSTEEIFSSNSSRQRAKRSPMKGGGESKNIHPAACFSTDSATSDPNQVLRSCQNIVENDRGITVAGSHVNQQFSQGYTRDLEEQKHVIVFELRGKKSDGEEVIKPILTRQKVECPTCGTKSHSGARYCSECTTALV